MMRYELVQLMRYDTCDNPIELDDYSSGSYAVYRANNNSRMKFIYFMPDEKRLTEPRCDYVLTNVTFPDTSSRFIELKGKDVPRQKRCCKTEWDHAFHQLVCTYREFVSYLNLPDEKVVFVLCTSIEKKRIAARYRNYKWYKELRENISSELLILYKGDIDTV